MFLLQVVVLVESAELFFDFGVFQSMVTLPKEDYLEDEVGRAEDQNDQADPETNVHFYFPDLDLFDVEEGTDEKDEQGPVKEDQKGIPELILQLSPAILLALFAARACAEKCKD